MKKQDNIGICALCKEKDVEIRQSHIIPKLAYKRVRSVPNSRFRILNNIKKPLQDGEKKHMLCDDCEKFFNKYETMFANKFFDSFINTGKIKGKITKQMWFFNYCLSVSWRILYDDIYELHSFENEYAYDGFIDFERQLSNYLNNLKNCLECDSSQYNNYVFKLSELTKDNKIIELFKPLLYGYCIYNPTYNFYLICTFYKGLLVVTEFSDERVIYISSFKDMWNRKHCKKYLINKLFKDEIVAQTQLVAQQYYENVTDKLKIDIENRYN